MSGWLETMPNSTGAKLSNERERERANRNTSNGVNVASKTLGWDVRICCKTFIYNTNPLWIIYTSISEVYSSLKHVSHAPLGALREHYFFDGIQLITDACVGGTLLYPEGTSRAHFVGVSPLDKLQSLGALTANFCTHVCTSTCWGTKNCLQKWTKSKIRS